MIMSLRVFNIVMVNYDFLDRRSRRLMIFDIYSYMSESV